MWLCILSHNLSSWSPSPSPSACLPLPVPAPACTDADGCFYQRQRREAGREGRGKGTRAHAGLLGWLDRTRLAELAPSSLARSLACWLAGESVDFVQLLQLLFSSR